MSVKKDKKRVGRFFILVALFYLAIHGLLYIQQRHLLYFPDTRYVQSDSTVMVQTEDGVGLQGLYAPPAATGSPVFVFFHGNAGHHGHRVFKAKPFIDKGYGFLIAGYRGYGGNPDQPSEEGLYKDARAYMDYLIDDQNIPLEQIVIYGESLGTGVAVQMATEYGVKALVLETPYDSMLHVAQHHYPYIMLPEYILKDQYRSDLKIKDIRAEKVLFLVAGKDEIIPAESTMRLYGLVEKPKEIHVFEAASHNTIYEFNALEIVSNFIGL